MLGTAIILFQSEEEGLLRMLKHLAHILSKELWILKNNEGFK